MANAGMYGTGHVVFSSPPLFHMTSFESEFLRPTVAASGQMQAASLDQADHRVDARFFGASIANLATVPHNPNISPSFASGAQSIPQGVFQGVPQSFPSQHTSYSPPVYTPQPPQPSFAPQYHPTPALPAPSFMPSPTFGTGTTLVPASPNYHGISSFEHEFLRPTVAARSPAEAQSLDAADGRYDSRFFGASVVTR